MKKTLLLFIVLCSTIIASAQVKCTSSNPSYELTYKRTVVAGNSVIVDFLVTLYGNVTKEFRVYEITVYDDEGNVYNFKANGTGCVDVGNTGNNIIYIEPDIPVKIRITVKNVDEYSTLFKKMIMPFGNGYDKNSFTITNIPIPRN